MNVIEMISHVHVIVVHNQNDRIRHLRIFHGEQLDSNQVLMSGFTSSNVQTNCDMVTNHNHSVTKITSGWVSVFDFGSQIAGGNPESLFPPVVD